MSFKICKERYIYSMAIINQQIFTAEHTLIWWAEMNITLNLFSWSMLCMWKHSGKGMTF